MRVFAAMQPANHVPSAGAADDVALTTASVRAGDDITTAAASVAGTTAIGPAPTAQPAAAPAPAAAPDGSASGIALAPDRAASRPTAHLPVAQLPAAGAGGNRPDDRVSAALAALTPATAAPLLRPTDPHAFPAWSGGSKVGLARMGAAAPA